MTLYLCPLSERNDLRISWLACTRGAMQISETWLGFKHIYDNFLIFCIYEFRINRALKWYCNTASDWRYDSGMAAVITVVVVSNSGHPGHHFFSLYSIEFVVLFPTNTGHPGFNTHHKIFANYQAATVSPSLISGTSGRSGQPPLGK